MVWAHLHQSPVGELLVAVDDGGVLLRLAFVQGGTERLAEEYRSSLGRDTAAARERCAEVCSQLDQYFTGTRQCFELELKPAGTDFQLRVWREVQKIPYGKTASYGEIAESLGSLGASRAVGAANGHNPIAIIIPCHRVIGSDRSLTGYGGGLAIKKALLQLEGALPTAASQTTFAF